MALKHKVSTMFKNWGSKRNENSDIKEIEDAIIAEQENINHKIADIGEYYWNQYSKNAFVPESESKELFLSIRKSLENIEKLKVDIEETKKNAIEERNHNEQELKEIEAKEAAEAEERKRQKAQAELDRLEAEKAARENEGKN